MNSVNKTLYIPLYAKAQVSRRGLILEDEKARQIWDAEQLPLKGKAKSKWLTYFMAMRARVFDDWTDAQLSQNPQAIVLHIGCGMDARSLRLGSSALWYDVDLPAVIAERKRYYTETDQYRMLAADASHPEWVAGLPESSHAIVIMEGLSMYLENHQVMALLRVIREKYHQVSLLMDVYTTFGAKATKYKNPINTVGVTLVYSIDDPVSVAPEGLAFVKEHTMTPRHLIRQLPGFDRRFFTLMFAGRATQKIYRLYEYRFTP